MFRLKRREKPKMKYDIELYGDGTYKLIFSFDVKNIVLKKAVESLARQQAKLYFAEEKFEELDFFVVDERFYGVVAKRLGKVIKEVEEQVREDIPTFKIVTGKINVIAFEKLSKDLWRAKLTMEGDYIK